MHFSLVLDMIIGIFSGNIVKNYMLGLKLFNISIMQPSSPSQTYGARNNN